MRAKRIAVACAMLALALIAPAVGRAATFEVNTTADGTHVGGCTGESVCSLRDAVEAASASADPEDTVVLKAGSYSLSEGALFVEGSGSVTLKGAGARSTTIDARESSRVFQLTAEKVRMEGLTITGGSSKTTDTAGAFPGDGGGILVVETQELTLGQVALVGNSADLNGGAIAAPPESSTIAATKLSIDASTVAGNHVAGGATEALGGGIYALGSLSLTNSTVTGNGVETTAGTPQGGGVLVGPDGVNPTTVSIVNATIAGNSVGTGGVGGGLAVYNPSMLTEPALSVKNTIISGNKSGEGEADCGAIVTVASDHNLSGDASCMFTDSGSKQNADPQLGALANNGGQTDTMALPAGSPAIDAGTNGGCPATDQRGVKRPQGSSCDIGAFEREPAPPTPAPLAPAAADLRLRIKPKPKKPKAGHAFAFLLTVSNRGPAAAPGVVVKGTVPALAKRVGGAKVGGRKPCKLGKAKKGKRQLTCRLGAIAKGRAVKLKVMVKPKHAGKLRVRARVRSGLPDPNLKDDKARATAKVAAPRGHRKK